MHRRIAYLLLIPLLLLEGGEVHRPSRHRAEWLEAGGVELRAIRAGYGDTTLVLLHGYGEHLLTWRSVFDPLTRDYQVIAVDLPGFGGSDKPDRPYTLEAMAGTIQRLLRRYTEPPVILIGHSMGGAIAAATAVKEPGRVAALVLIAPAGIDVSLAGVLDSMSHRRSALIGAWEAARSSIIPMHDPDWIAESANRAKYDPALDPAFRSATARVLRDFQFEGLAALYRELRQPVQLIWGAADPVVPVQVADSLTKLLPCHQLAILDRTLHRPQVERPDTVVAILKRFLRQPGC